MIHNVEISGSDLFEANYDTLPAYVFVERKGRIVYANLAARQILGAQPGESFDRPTGEIFWELSPSPVDPSGLMNIPDQAQGFESQIRGAKDQVIPVRGVCNLADPEKNESIIIAVPTPNREGKEYPNLFGEVISSAPEAIAITRGTVVLHINPEFTRLFGYSAEEAMGKDLSCLIFPENCEKENAQFYPLAQEQGRVAVETLLRNKDGELIDVSLLLSPLIVRGEHVGYYSSYRDIRDRKKIEAKLQHDAFHDSLTGLANRGLFLNRLQSAFDSFQKRDGAKFAVMFLDLDKFKEVNDTLGHACGDEVLKTIAERLRNCFRPEDTIARFGGDEFAVLLEYVETSMEVQKIASRVAIEVAKQMKVFGNVLDLSTSVGIAFATKQHEVPAEILRDADYAMYRAKSRGGSRYEIFDDYLLVHAATQQQQEQELRRIIEKREFEVWYQPVYGVLKGDLRGFEALLRWRRPDGSFASFFELLPVADGTGLMVSLGMEVVERACKQLKSWMQEFHRPLFMSVNLSARQFMQPDLSLQIAHILSRLKIPAQSLYLEISESALNQNHEGAVAAMRQLVKQGVRVALDNFGADLAAVNHLLELPLDMVKLDRRLISRSNAGGRNSAFLQNLFEMGRGLKLNMLAEGVENIDQFEFLRNCGCELAQGHLFAEPMSAEKSAVLLQHGQWPSEFMA